MLNMKFYTANIKTENFILKYQLRPLWFFKTLRVFLILVISIENIPLLSQNTYDLEHSTEYAEYLYKSSEFKLASQELERILFLNPSNLDARLKLIKSYRYLKADSIALSRLTKFYPDLSQIPEKFACEYLNLSILQKKYNTARDFIEVNQFVNEENKIFYSSLIEPEAESN